MGTIKPKGLKRIAKIGYGHLCLREENLSFINNYIKVILHQFWVKKCFHWKFNLEYGGTFTKLFIFQVEICSQQLEICKSVCMFTVLTIVADHDLVKKMLVRWLPIMTSWRKDKQSWMMRHTFLTMIMEESVCFMSCEPIVFLQLFLCGTHEIYF